MKREETRKTVREIGREKRETMSQKNSESERERQNENKSVHCSFCFAIYFYAQPDVRSSYMIGMCNETGYTGSFDRWLQLVNRFYAYRALLLALQPRRWKE